MVKQAAIDSSPKAITFGEARELYLETVYGFVARRIRPREDAEDIVAQVFVDAYRHWGRRQGDARLWLLGIARRKVADALRKRREWWPLREEDGIASDAMLRMVQSAEAKAAREIVRRLPADERDALLMQILEEMSISEIAAVLGRSSKATNSLLQRARARVRKMTGEETRG